MGRALRPRGIGLVAAVAWTGEPLTLEALRGAGLSREALAGVMVAEFASVVVPKAVALDPGQRPCTLTTSSSTASITVT